MILKHKKTAHISPCTAVKPTWRATVLENASSVKQWENTDTKPTRVRSVCSWKHGRSNPNKQELCKNNKKRNWLHPFFPLSFEYWTHQGLCACQKAIQIWAYQSKIAFMAKFCLPGERCSTTMLRKPTGSASVGAIALISTLMVLCLNRLVV